MGNAERSLAGSAGAEPQRKSNLVHYSLKILHLVASNLLIFMRISWSQCTHFFYLFFYIMRTYKFLLSNYWSGSGWVCRTRSCVRCVTCIDVDIEMCRPVGHSKILYKISPHQMLVCCQGKWALLQHNSSCTLRSFDSFRRDLKTFLFSFY